MIRNFEFKGRIRTVIVTGTMTSMSINILPSIEIMFRKRIQISIHWLSISGWIAIYNKLDNSIY